MRKAVESCTEDGIRVGVSLGGHQITDLDYADDIALLASNVIDIQHFVNKVAFFGNLVGLKINSSKTKVMHLCGADSTNTPVLLDGTVLEIVDSFCYLGSVISADSSCEQDIRKRSGFAEATFQQLYNCLFSRNDISISTKMRVYLASVRSVLLYSCESWTLTDLLSSHLEISEMSFLRRILGIKVAEHVSNVMIRDMCGVKECISTIIQRRRLTWLGHVLRMQEDRIPRQTFTDKRPSDWKRLSGRPRYTWDKVIHAETHSLTKQVRHYSGTVADWTVDGYKWIFFLSDLASTRHQ